MPPLLLKENMSNSFNFRNPDPGEVQRINLTAKEKRMQREKYEVLSKLLNSKGKDVDITQSELVFEALNREKMEFEQILKLHPKDAKDAMEQVRIDREFFKEGTHWNPNSKAKWGIKGHVPLCCYYARPPEYWKNKDLINNFFNTFTKFRISTKKI